MVAAQTQNSFTESKEDLAVNKAKKFSLWLGMIGMFMMFAALSSGFIVYTQGGIDKGIKTLLPNSFIYSTIVILLSSFTLHLAMKAARSAQIKKQKVLVLVTFLLGVAFFVIQVDSWSVLTQRGIYFINTNASQSFVYVFTGMHLAHILGGLLVLLRILVGNMNKISQVRNVFRMELATIFWHFLDFLWIYIYIFLLLNQ